MPFLLNIIGAIVCVSMARKQGRGLIRWFLLGLVFHVFAIFVLYRKGRRDQVVGASATPATRTNLPPPPTPRVAAPQPVVRQQPEGPRALQQQGHVDLNALRAAVANGGMSQQGFVAESAVQREPALPPDRQAFLQLVETTAPSITFPALAPHLGEVLRICWLYLGRAFAHSDEAGGLTDSNEFYQLESDGRGSPVLFYPVLQEGASNPVIQFACPVKRFRQVSGELENWVLAQPSESFAVATLFRDDASGESVLLAAGVLDPATTLIDKSTLGELCLHVRSEANDLRRDIPARFGGIWATG